MIPPIDYIDFDTLPSTQTWAKKHVSLFHPQHITCVRAREQTAGKATHGRAWTSPPGGNLYVSLFFVLPQHFPYLHNLGQLFCLSCAHVLCTQGVQPRLKWPNDVLLNNKKCAGVLVETFSQGVLLGFGMNVTTSVTTDQPTTSLREESRCEWSSSDLLSSLLVHFFSQIPLLQEQGFAPFLAIYEKLLMGKEGRLRVMHAGQPVEGCYEKIDAQGKLHLRLDSGESITVV